MTKPVTPEVEIAALEAARKFFLKLHPLEKPDSVKSKTVIYWFFLAIAIASAALAALRTGPVFFESAHQNLPAGIAVIEALLAIVAIDIAAAVLAFFLVSEKSKRHGVNHDLGKVIFSTLIFCLIIQVAANLYSVAGPVLLTTGGHRTAELIIATLVGLAAPVVAYISGHGLGVLHVQHEAWIYDEMRDYEQKRQDLYSAFETWYDAKQRREWLARVQVLTVQSNVQISSIEHPILPANVQMNAQLNTESSTAHKQNYTRDATQRVIQLFEQQPEALQWPVRKVAEVAQVSSGTVVSAKRAYSNLPQDVVE